MSKEKKDRLSQLLWDLGIFDDLTHEQIVAIQDLIDEARIDEVTSVIQNTKYDKNVSNSDYIKQIHKHLRNRLNQLRSNKELRDKQDKVKDIKEEMKKPTWYDSLRIKQDEGK